MELGTAMLRELQRLPFNLSYLVVSLVREGKYLLEGCGPFCSTARLVIPQGGATAQNANKNLELLAHLMPFF